MTKLVRRVFSLTEEQARFVDECVLRDGYSSPSHAVQHALDELMSEFSRLRSPEFAQLMKREVLPVLERVHRGEEKLIPAEEVFDHLEALLKSKIKAAE